MHQEVDAALDALAKNVVDAAFKVHRALGPGLLESAYLTCLGIELRKRSIRYETQVPVDILYAGETVESALRLDMLVDGRLIVETKSVEKLLPIHEAQLLTYLRLTGRRLGMLINCNVALIKNGIRRLAL